MKVSVRRHTRRRNPGRSGIGRLPEVSHLCYDCADDGLFVESSFLDEHRGHDLRQAPPAREALAEKAYDEAVASAQKAYDEAVASAQKAYDEAVARMSGRPQ